MASPCIERQAFLTRLESLVAESANAESATGLMLIDLLNLKQINHRHSFSLGDALLKETAETLKTLAGDDCVFRLGGHTFAVIVPGVQTPALLIMAVNRFRQALDDALYMESHFTAVKHAIGLSVTSERVPGALALLAHAEIHLDEVRSSGHIDLDHVLQGTFDIAGVDELGQPFEEALRNNEFMLYYQPQIDLRTGGLAGAEALLRWECGEHGFISPERIVRLAEEFGLLFELTKSLAHVATRQIGQWREAGLDFPVALNLPASLVSDPELRGMLQSALKIWGAPTSALMLEITEQALVQDLESNATNLEQLRDDGFQISIDDFGTGYSSLSYFRNIPATELKVDRSFVSRLLSSDQDRELTRIIIEIAHLFDMHVVAEGVEDYATLAALQEMGCDVLQGYYTARPMPAEAFDQWMSEWAGLDAFVAATEGEAAPTSPMRVINSG